MPIKTYTSISVIFGCISFQSSFEPAKYDIFTNAAMNIAIAANTDSQKTTVDFIEESEPSAPVTADIAADAVFAGVTGVEPVATDDIL